MHTTYISSVYKIPHHAKNLCVHTHVADAHRFMNKAGNLVLSTSIVPVHGIDQAASNPDTFPCIGSTSAAPSTPACTHSFFYTNRCQNHTKNDGIMGISMDPVCIHISITDSMHCRHLAVKFQKINFLCEHIICRHVTDLFFTSHRFVLHKINLLSIHPDTFP